MKLGKKTKMKLQLAEFPAWAGFYGRHIVSLRPSNQIRFTLNKHVFGTYGDSVVKSPPTTAGDTGDVGSIPGSERCPGEGNGNPLQHPCLENLKDRGTWWTAVHGVERVRHDWVTNTTHSHSQHVSLWILRPHSFYSWKFVPSHHPLPISCTHSTPWPPLFYP